MCFAKEVTQNLFRWDSSRVIIDHTREAHIDQASLNQLTSWHKSLFVNRGSELSEKPVGCEQDQYEGTRPDNIVNKKVPEWKHCRCFMALCNDQKCADLVDKHRPWYHSPFSRLGLLGLGGLGSCSPKLEFAKGFNLAFFVISPDHKTSSS